MSQGTTEDEKDSLARSQLPYRAEYCKSSRAKCKKCSEPMATNSLKLANMVKSRWHDGYDANFYHIACFFQVKRPTSVAEIGHFEALKFEDQKMLEKAVETNGLSVLGAATVVSKSSDKDKSKGSSKKSSSKKREPANASLVNYKDFLVEYAKSNRSKCVACELKIDKDTVRVGKLDFAAETQWTGGPVPRWYHIECFVKQQIDLAFFGDITQVEGYNSLEKDDQKELRTKIKPIEPPSDASNGGGKKLKIGVEEDNQKLEQEEKALRKQSRRFFKLREEINNIKRKDLETMLEYMNQRANFKSSASLTDAATDVLMFGPLAPCPICKKSGNLVLRGGAYICLTDTDGVQCTYETREPKRYAPDIPLEVFDKYSFLNQQYEFIGRQRIFPSTFIKAVEKKEAEVNKIVQEGAPLEGLSIGIISWKSIKQDKTQVQNKITVLGGKLETALQRSLFVILTSESELSNDTNPKVEVAKALDVPFATADFIFKVDTKDDVVREMSKCFIGDWKGDLNQRFLQHSGRLKSEN